MNKKRRQPLAVEMTANAIFKCEVSNNILITYSILYSFRPQQK